VVLQIRLLEQARAGAALRSWQASAVQFTAKICGLVGRATTADPLSGGGAFSSLSARCFLSLGQGEPLPRTGISLENSLPILCILSCIV
jgi:hypothetical protein